MTYQPFWLIQCQRKTYRTPAVVIFNLLLRDNSFHTFYQGISLKLKILKIDSKYLETLYIEFFQRNRHWLQPRLYDHLLQAFGTVSFFKLLNVAVIDAFFPSLFLHRVLTVSTNCVLHIIIKQIAV